MSGATRSPGDEPEAEEPKPQESLSPGRYSLAKEGSTQMSAVRIDSTRMNAVRPESGDQPPPRRQTSPHGMQAVVVPPVALPAGEPVRGITAVPPPPSYPAPAPLPVPTRASSTKTRAGLTPPPRGTIRGVGIGGDDDDDAWGLPVAASRPPPSTRISSLRPPPPPKRESRPAAAPFEGFDEGSIAHAFDALMSEGTTGLAGRDIVDLAPVRELFAELAANHMRHVRDFMIDVKWGEAPREWIEISIPAVTSLRRAAERLELRELAFGLDRFGVELHATLNDPAARGARSDGTSPASPGRGRNTIEGSAKEHLLVAYDELTKLLPQAFALDRDKSQREAVIVQSLCLSVPDVRKVTIDKLHAAGLMSLKTLFDANAHEIAQVAGIPASLASRIVERFQAYRYELQNASPQDARAAERERLATLTGQLREQHDGYEEASKGWSPDAKAKKRDLFRAREESWLAISLLLARFGEVERLQGIEKVPFAQRIAQLSDYLEEARDRYRSE